MIVTYAAIIILSIISENLKIHILSRRKNEFDDIKKQEKCIPLFLAMKYFFSLIFIFGSCFSTSRSNKPWMGNSQKFNLWLPQSTMETMFSNNLVRIISYIKQKKYFNCTRNTDKLLPQ